MPCPQRWTVAALNTQVAPIAYNLGARSCLEQFVLSPVVVDLLHELPHVLWTPGMAYGAKNYLSSCTGSPRVQGLRVSRAYHPGWPAVVFQLTSVLSRPSRHAAFEVGHRAGPSRPPFESLLLTLCCVRRKDMGVMISEGRVGRPKVCRLFTC